MADVQSNIQVSIDTTQALASIKNLQRQISAFHSSMAKGGAAANAVSAQMQQTLLNSINAGGKFSAQIRTIKTTTESFTDSLQKNKFSIGEYFRYAGGASKTFGRLFKTEFDTINKVARENVKDLQTQYIRLGRDASGAMKSIAVRPLALDMNDLGTKTQIAAQKQALLNQLLKQGSTNLLNFGKNTQWAGRQLMVGFTLPLMAVGSAASKTFMDMETQAIRFKKVYGDLFTPTAESAQALKDIQDLGKEFTKYGISVATTVGLAAEAAAAGFQGVDLQRQTAAATKLSILGQVESQKALETTISLQNAFAMSSENLAESIDFLNAVENQTVLSLDDVSTAIPKAAPIVQQLGGDVKDLAFFMTAMKEGGINASEGANALKSGLASLINPTGKANDMLLAFGINAKKIVVDNKGDLKKTVIEFATALNQLDPLNRAQAIEQMFGKFQFSRLSTLFANVTKEGTQAARVLDLAGSSVQELAALSEKELGMTSESAMNKFKGAVESLKLSLVPLGEEFLKAVTPVAEFVTKLLDKFNGLSDNTKKVIVTLTAIIGGLGPVFLMTFGLLANGLANIIKGFTVVKSLFNKTGQETGTLGTATKYMTAEQRNAAAVAASLDQVHTKLKQTFTSEAAAVNLLTQAYQRAVVAQASFIPVAAPMGRGPAPTKRAKGKPAIVGGTGNKDSELALLMPGETVIPTKMSQKYGGIINAMIADRVPGYKRGKGGVKNPGMFKAVDIPGGYDASHFGGSSYATGQELLDMVDGLNDTISKNIKKMVMSFEDGLTKTFTTFDNRVVAQDTSINRDMKYKGSVDIFRARENLTGKGFSEVRDIQLQKELTDAGMSIDEYKKVNKQITTEIVKGFDALGSKTTVTSDELDKLLRNSYDAVAKTDTRIQEANNRLRAITTVTDPKTSSRIAINPQSYRLNRADSEFNQQGVATRGIYALGMDKVSGPGKSPYSPYSRIGFKAASANALGLSLQDSTRVFNQFSKDVKVRLSLLKDDVDKFTTMFVAEAEKSGIKSGNSYKVGIDKSTLKDIYVESRERQSPHPLAPKDGKDDARAYAIARDKELKKQSGRQPGAATRGQGPAPIGATPQPGMTVLPIVPGGSSQTVDPNNPPTNNPPTNNKTILQRLGGAVKGIGGKITGMGGGMGLLGLNMGLSMAPDFAGKGIAQSTTTGASLGMFLGPKGTAIGAGIGFATSSLSALNKKIKEYGEVNKSVFTISNSLITAFGDKVLDTKVKVTELSKSSVGLRDKFGLLSPQVQAIIDDLKKLPEDDPLAIFIKSISTTGQSLSEVTGNLRSKLTTDISIGGLDPENAQKYVYTLMVAAGKANEFGAVWKSISKDVIDVSTATEASFNKVGDAVNMAGGSFTFLEGRTGDVAKDYDELRDSAKTLSDQMFSFFGVLSNGAFTYDQIQERLQAFSRSSVDAKTGVLALQAAVKASSDPILIERFALIERIIKESGKAATATAADYTMLHLALEMLGAQGKNLDILRTDLFPDEAQRALARRYATDSMLLDALMKGEDFQKYVDGLAEAREKLNNIFNNDDYKDYEDGVDGLSASSKAYLDILEKEIKGLEEKRDAQKNANDETQRQIDLQEKLADLAKKSVLAKISGDYLEAASLQQQAQNVQVEFNQETELRKKDAEIARLRSRAEAIGDGAPLTKAEAAKIPKKVKAASGGMIRGAGTGTSDSIPAYLSNGEYVVKADSVKKYGVGTFDALNTQKFKEGGLASRPKYGTRPEEKKNWWQRYLDRRTKSDQDVQEMLNKFPLTSWMGADSLGTTSFLKSITGQGTKSDKITAALFPLNFMGMGSAKGALVKPASALAKTKAAEIAAPVVSKQTPLITRTKEVQEAIDEAKKWNLYRKNELTKIEASNPEFLKLFKLLKDVDAETHALKISGARDLRGPLHKTLYDNPDSTENKLFKKLSGNDNPFWKYLKSKHYFEDDLAKITSAEKYNIKPMEVAALRNYLEKPLTGHLSSLKSPIEELVSKFVIPEGTVSYRGLSDIDMEALSKISVGESFISPTVRSITDDKVAAAAIGAFGGTSGGGTNAIARIIFGTGVKGIPDISLLGEAQGLSHEGIIGPNTKFILEKIIKGSTQASRFENQTGGVHMMRSLPGEGSIITQYLDEYVLRAVGMNLGGLVKGYKEGGMVKKYAMGGLIKGPGTSKSDSIRATLGYAGGGSIRVSNGEYVVKASSVKDYGVNAMNAVNNGTATIGTNSGGTVYNINMPITSNNANPEIVANEVMRKLKLEVSKNNKSNKVGL
jgi:TP901 family phage tail tape measure protein